MVYPFEALPLQPAGLSSADVQVYAIIEQAYGTKEQIAWNRTSRALIQTGLVMEQPLPVPYGWIPQTRNSSDGDALDGWGDATPARLMIEQAHTAFVEHSSVDSTL